MIAEGSKMDCGVKAVGVQSDTRKRELLKNPTKIEEIREKNLLTEI